MKKLMFVLTVVVTQNVFAGELADALKEAIQSSDSEKSNTKVALLVTEDHIEKATFKRGQKKQIIKDESTVIADNTYMAPETQKPANLGEEKLSLEALEKELSDKK